MEQAERSTASRSQNVVHFLPRTADALARVIAPALERIDASQASLQLLVITSDAESAVVVADLVSHIVGPQGVEVLPVTAANRAARMLAERPVHALAGPAIEIQSLIQRSAIKLEDLRTVVLSWVDDHISDSPLAVEAIESIFAELPKTTTRVMVARRATPDVEKLIDSHLRTARRITQPDAAAADVPQITPAAASVHYMSVTGASRPAALRRLLDDLDPPSATIVVRDPASEADATQTVRSLGYRRTDDPIKVARYETIPPSHTVILYDSPVMPSEIAAAGAAGPVQIVALATPRDMIPLHELSPSLVPLTLEGPGAAARSRDASLREELALLLSQGVATREMLALEPLLDRYDGIEIAAAAIRLLDAERARRAAAPKQILRLVAPDSGTPPREARGSERGSASGSSPARDERKDARGRDDRPPRGREFRGPPRGGPKSERGERKDWSQRPPRRDGSGTSAGGAGAGERRERNLGRGPRSGGPGRDDRSVGPKGPPKRPRPFDR
jgi:ATP-dependent RNA helicase DeaD